RAPNRRDQADSRGDRGDRARVAGCGDGLDRRLLIADFKTFIADVRAVVGGAGDGERARLDLLGLLEGDDANADALASYEGYYVFGTPEQAEDVHRQALLRQPMTQALIQGLHGRGLIPFDGVLHFLARHRLARLDE